MAEKIKFHLDENVSTAIAEGLRRRGVNLTTTPELSLIGVSDRVQLEFALLQKRVFYSRYRFSENASDWNYSRWNCLLFARS